MRHTRMTAAASAYAILAIALLSSLPLVSVSLAQRGAAGRGHGARIYDPRTVETLSGEVVRVKRVAPKKKRLGKGIRLLLKTDKETISVRLGPAWYLEDQKTRIAATDRVTVTGSRVMIEGKPVIIAAEVQKGDAKLVLRDANGVPQWSQTPGGRVGRVYHPSTVETLSGEVVSVERVAPKKEGAGMGIHLVLKTDKETISVHLGPAWYVDSQATKITATDQVTVTGSRVALEGKPVIIAAEVHKGDATLALRDTSGVPLWSRGGAGKGPGRRVYDPGTVETISGEVVSVERVASKKGLGMGIHLTLKTDKETISVHLGPAWYVDGQATKIAAADQVTVTGSRVTLEGKPVIIAAEVHKGDATLALRDTDGVPLWSGGARQRRRPGVTPVP